MKMLAGVTAAIGLTGKAEEPKYFAKLDFLKSHLTDYEPKKKESDKEGKDYNLIADLVEEMKGFDKKVPNQNITYFIHCNYTGLAFLNDTGLLCEKEADERILNPWWRFILWIPVYHHGTYHGVVEIRMRPEVIGFDIGLSARYKTKSVKNNLNLVDTWIFVTTRCFNVNRDEEGRIIANLESGQVFCRAEQLEERFKQSRTDYYKHG
jgi:hypothetical protein